MFWQNFAQSLYSTIPYGGPYFSTLPPPANLTDALGSTIVTREQSFRNHLFKLNTSYTILPSMHSVCDVFGGFPSRRRQRTAHRQLHFLRKRDAGAL